MKRIRLLHPFTFHHAEIPGGTEISVPPDLADRFVENYQVAEYAEPERAVIAPSETRVIEPVSTAMKKPEVRRSGKRRNAKK